MVKVIYPNWFKETKNNKSGNYKTANTFLKIKWKTKGRTNLRLDDKNNWIITVINIILLPYIIMWYKYIIVIIYN